MEAIALKKGFTASQVALSWVEQLSGRNGNPVIIPIPGTTSTKRLDENMKRVNLTEDDFKHIDEILKKVTIKGDRYGGALAALMNG